MPFYWTIDSRLQLMKIQAEGKVTLSDCVQLVETIAGARCISYAKLLDAHLATLEAAHEEVMQVVVLLRAHHQRDVVGPLAIVTAPEKRILHPHVLGALAAADRPIRIFANSRKALRWLTALRPDAGGSPMQEGA